MKTMFAIFALSITIAAMAAPTQRQINARAQELLLDNLSDLSYPTSDSEFGPLSVAWDNYADSDGQVRTSCAFDRGDQLFECSTTITTRVIGSGGVASESALTVAYELEKGRDGLPSAFATLTVRIRPSGV